MNIVCLSTLSVTTGYIVERLLEAFPETKLIRIRHQSKSRPFWKRVRGTFGKHGWQWLERRLYYSRYHAHGTAEVRRLLYGDRSLPDLPVVAEMKQLEVNQLANANLIHSLQPDLMITVGAPILRPHIFAIPRLGTINVHFGIAPHYRGEDTLFWPLYCRDEHQIGVTIHQIDRGVDTGPMLAQSMVAIDSQDNEWTLEAKAARAGADLLVELLRAEELQPCWQPPRHTGKQFSIKSRHVWHDAWLFLRRRWLRESLRTISQQTIHYCRPSMPVEAEVLDQVRQLLTPRVDIDSCQECSASSPLV